MSEEHTEQRIKLMKQINADPKTREELEQEHGQGNVWNTEEARDAFDFVGFMAPFVAVVRKSDGKEGMLTFQHAPRFYWDFK